VGGLEAWKGDSMPGRVVGVTHSGNGEEFGQDSAAV